MAEFRDYLAGLGFENVQTYVQSGNAVFTSDLADCEAVRAKASEGLLAAFGFQPQIMVLTAGELREAIRANPYPLAVSEPTSLHLGFMQSEPAQTAIELLKLKPNAGEQWTVMGKLFYLHSPLGMGKSVLAPFIERTLKVPVTMRNWNTVIALAEMAGQ